MIPAASSSLRRLAPWPARAGAWLPLSVGLHAAAGATWVALPEAWPWVLGAVGVNHGVLTGAGLLPRSRLLGPNLRHLGEAGAHALVPATAAVALTLDDGPDPEVTPRVLDALDAGGAKASFFVIGTQARRHPALVREIVARGHSVQNHSAAHRHHFSLMGPRRLAAEIGDAQSLLADLSGVRPHCFRAPAGLRSPLLEPVLARHGLHLVSWTRRGFDTRERSAARVLARLTHRLAGGDILLLHDGHAQRDAAGAPVVLEVLPRLLAALRVAGLGTLTLAEALRPRPLPAARAHAP